MMSMVLIIFFMIPVLFYMNWWIYMFNFNNVF